ncbi:hypothetical protein AWW71_29640 [Bacillus cereus]|nr:hypothetical protein AWW71_29640 [Bacillus cereus]
MRGHRARAAGARGSGRPGHDAGQGTGRRALPPAGPAVSLRCCCRHLTDVALLSRVAAGSGARAPLPGDSGLALPGSG